jgi:activating signal cointegrator complex subunit 2
MTDLPPFASFPPATLRLQVAPDEWQGYIEAWILLAEAYLESSEPIFDSVTEHADSSVVHFVRSYVHEYSESSNQSLPRSSRSIDLHKLVYLLCHRLLSSKSNQALLHWSFLSEFSHLFSQVSNIGELLNQAWQIHSIFIEKGLQELKTHTIQRVDNHISEDWVSKLQLLTHLIRFCPPIGVFFATGSDLLDSLASEYPKSSTAAQQIVTVFTYLVLLSLVKIPKPNFSALSDHLFFLKSNAKDLQQKKQSSILSSLVSNTDLVKKLHNMSESDSDSPGSVAPRDLSVGLLEFRSKRNRSRRKQKGKGRVVNDADDAIDAVHIHRMSLITQVQDLFPDLGSGFIAKLLDEYNEDFELVTAHLLDDSLPPHLENADRSELLQHSVTSPYSTTEHIDHVPSSPQFLPRRHNVFDGDELDDLAVEASKLHIGKANETLTADTMLARGSGSHKAAILAALAQFDSDDDERDDAYDADDVGGTIDTTVDTDRDPALTSNDAGAGAELILYRAWKSDQSVFDRDVGSRRSLNRSKLKQETGWTDEAIEGWAVMLSREPQRMRTLEKRYANDWKGEQRSIERTAWRAGQDDDSGAESGGGRGGHFGRGRGSWRGTRGAAQNSSGQTDDRGTQKSRQRKEVRGGGGHNRREGRAKKMARGMS